MSFGYPVHAGIDPETGCAPSRVSRLPRTRGDRPLDAPPESLCPLATPYTRGSTLRLVAHHRAFRGYPVHAGIDLNISWPSSARVWLPRTRGDRPVTAHVKCVGNLATPYTRGSTPVISCTRLYDRGYPVHAGIDLSSSDSAVVVAWLPRTRGDRPLSVENLLTPDGATPYTRGSTLIEAEIRHYPRGYPVHAGIDPPRKKAGTPNMRLPRTRGDRP